MTVRGDGQAERGGHGDETCTLDLSALVADAAASIALVQMQHYEAAFLVVYTLPGGLQVAAGAKSGDRTSSVLDGPFQVLQGEASVPPAVLPLLRRACQDVKLRFPVTREQLLARIWPSIPLGGGGTGGGARAQPTASSSAATHHAGPGAGDKPAQAEPRERQQQQQQQQALRASSGSLTASREDPFGSARAGAASAASATGRSVSFSPPDGAAAGPTAASRPAVPGMAAATPRSSTAWGDEPAAPTAASGDGRGSAAGGGDGAGGGGGGGGTTPRSGREKRSLGERVLGVLGAPIRGLARTGSTSSVHSVSVEPVAPSGGGGVAAVAAAAAAGLGAGLVLPSSPSRASAGGGERPGVAAVMGGSGRGSAQAAGALTRGGGDAQGAPVGAYANVPLPQLQPPAGAGAGAGGQPGVTMTQWVVPAEVVAEPAAGAEAAHQQGVQPPAPSGVSAPPPAGPAAREEGGGGAPRQASGRRRAATADEAAGRGGGGSGAFPALPPFGAASGVAVQVRT